MEPTSTRLKIMRVGERLFTERGVDGVTLLEIAKEAGQKNRAAVQYHFTDRRGLVEAILERHSSVVQQSWIEPLAMLRRENLLTLERAVGLMLGSLVRRSQHEDGGRAYIQICRQLLVHPTIPLMQTRMVMSEGALLMQTAINEMAHMPKGFEVLWPMRMAHLLFHSIGDYLDYGHLTRLSLDDFEQELRVSVVGWLRSHESSASEERSA